MKHLRYFLTLMLLLVAKVGFADEVTWDLSTNSYASASEDLVSWTSDYVTMEATNGSSTNANNYLGGDANNRTSSRFYKGATLTITPADGYTISSVVFTATNVNYASALQSSSWTNATATEDGTTVTVTPTDGTEAIVATIGGTTGHTQVVVTYASNGSSTLKPAGLSFGTTEFVIELGADFTAPSLNNPNNLTVTYTSDNEDVAEVDEETGEVTIGEDEGTATITASFGGNDEYKAGSASYTITVKAPVQTLTNIAALSSMTESGEYAVTLNNAVVTYVNGNYAYIQDESGAIVMYKSGHGLSVGQVLNGTVTVTYQVRNANPQITALSGFTATDGTAPDPTVVAATSWNTPIANVLSQYFKVTGATITKDGNKYYVQLGDENVQLYGQGDARTISVPDLDITYTIVGFPTMYNATPELQIFVQPEAEQTVVPTPTFNPVAGNVFAGSAIVIVCPEDAEGVEYSFDQEEWMEYTEPIEITESTTIYARAYDEDANYSEVVSATYTVVEIGTDKYELVTDASTLAEGDEIIIAFVDEDSAALAMGGQNSNNRAAVEVTYNEDDTLTPNSDAQVITLEGDEDGWYFNIGDGYLYAAASDKNYLRTEAEADDNAKAEISIDESGDATIIFQGTNSRNHLRFNANNGNPMFSCYAETSSVVTLPRIYKKVQETVPVTIGATGYATLYYSDKALDIPEDVRVSIVTSVDKGSITLEELEQRTIPAGTGVVLQGVAGDYEFTVSNENPAAPEDNMLKGSDVATLTEGDGKFYQLSLNAEGDAESIGFYYGADNGAAFMNGAHKAYLVVPAAQAAKGYSFNGLVTAIRNISTMAENAEIYTVGGVRVSGNNLPKGIYIVNGKKMVVK